MIFRLPNGELFVLNRMQCISDKSFFEKLAVQYCHATPSREKYKANICPHENGQNVVCSAKKTTSPETVC